MPERNIETKEVRGIQTKHIVMTIGFLMTMTASIVGGIMKVDNRLSRIEEKMVGVDVLQKQVSQLQVAQDIQQVQINDIKRRIDEADNRKQREEDLIRTTPIRRIR